MVYLPTYLHIHNPSLPSPINLPTNHLPPPPQSSQNTTYSAAVLSALTSLGGIAGYARTGSVPSIAAGLSVGALYALSYFRLQGHQPYGEELGLLASVVLGGSAIPRAIKTQKPVPLGLREGNLERGKWFVPGN
ncbi:hypothetical protein PRK78_004340 [Emydomyces testavorans]|uniref:Transmembrane proteins 14C-domain-containing protein n=1 Tax=Emydomyces testavorans TaxID=2070801 RepID=A0AAF0IJF9_9EURO|nr:hypothetical protein PRK78_004340 [Emydomyces testavorans]